jgi:hypothetical protein
MIQSIVVNGVTNQNIDGNQYSVPWTSSGGSIVNNWQGSTPGASVEAGVGAEQFYSTASASAQGNMVVTFKWVGSGSAPAYFSAAITSSAVWAVVSDFQDGIVNVPSASATDGFADGMLSPAFNTYAIGQSGISKPLSPHLEKVQVQNGAAQLTLPIVSALANGSFTPGLAFPYEYAEIESEVSLNVQYDPRAVFIASDLGTTYHKGADGSPQANVPLPDGTLFDDTLQPLDDNSGNQITPDLMALYSGGYTGRWGVNSQYHWYSSLKQDANSGAFEPGSIGSMSETYTPADFPPANNGMSDTREHVFLSGNDSVDGARATANYYLTFHQPFENWITQGTVVHPLPVATSITFAQCQQAQLSGNNGMIGDWTVYGPYTNPLYIPTSLAAKSSVSYSVATGTTGTITAGYSLGLSFDEINYAFQVNEGVSITNSNKITVSFGMPNPTFPPRSVNYILIGEQYNHVYGITDTYGANGFQGIADWYYNSYPTSPVNPEANFVVTVISQAYP